MKPIVDGLERELGEDLQVISVNIQDPKGRELVEKYRFEFTPTFIYFDPDGTEAWRSVGNLDVDKIRGSLP